MKEYIDYNHFVEFLTKRLHLSNNQYMTNPEMYDPSSSVYQKSISDLEDKIKLEIFPKNKFDSAIRPINEYFEKLQNNINNIDEIKIEDYETSFINSKDKKKNIFLVRTDFFYDSLRSSYGVSIHYNNIPLEIKKKSLEKKIKLDNEESIMEISYKEAYSVHAYVRSYLESISLATSSDKKEHLKQYFLSSSKNLNIIINERLDFDNLMNVYNFLEDIQTYADVKKMFGASINLKNMEENDLLKITHDIDLESSFKKYLIKDNKLTNKNTI